MYSLLLRSLTCLSLFTFRLSFGIVIPDSPKCSLHSVAHGVFPEGCFMDIDDVVTSHSCQEDLDLDPRSVMTAVNIGNSNRTDLYVLNWDLMDYENSRQLLFNTDIGMWMSSPFDNDLPRPSRSGGSSNCFLSLCSKIIFYVDDLGYRFVAIVPGDFPFQNTNFFDFPSTFSSGDMTYHYVKISKPSVSSDCDETVIVIGLLKGDVIIWQLSYDVDVHHHYFNFNGFFEVSASRSSNLREDGFAVSIKEAILYIVCNNETSSTLKREVWHLSVSNMTWDKVGMISVPYKEKKLFGHFIDSYSILVICSTMSCTKYNYDLGNWYIKEIIDFASNNVPGQNAFSFYENSIIIRKKCLFHNLTFTATKTIIGEIQSKAKDYLSFESARNIVSTTKDNTQYFLFFLNLQTAVVLKWYFEREVQYEVQYQVYPSYRSLPYIYGYTLSAIEGHLMVFGGVKGIYDPYVLPKSEKNLNAEIWYFDYDLNTYSNQRWWNFSSIGSNFPPARFFHSAVFAYDDDSFPYIIVYGGLGFVKEKLEVFNDLWKFEVGDRSDLFLHFPDSWKWRRIFQAEDQRPFPQMFRHMASPSPISYGFLVFGCEMFSPKDYCNETNAFLLPIDNSSIWIKVLLANTHGNSGTYQLISGRSPIINGFEKYDLFALNERSVFSYETAGFWLPFARGAGILLALDICGFNELSSGNIMSIYCAIFLVPDLTKTTTRARSPKFFIAKANCPDGSERMPDLLQYYRFGCKICSVGSYSFNGSSCLKCPSVLTNNKNGSKDCNICSKKGENVCQKGSCHVNNNTMMCKCQRGYNRDDHGYCTVKSTIQIATLSSSGAVLLVVVAAVLIILYKLYQIKKRNEANLKSFENVWNIGFQEIKFDKRLDTEISGAYGEVYRGNYRQIAVAIKRLQYYQMQIIKRSRMEFAREIEVMKTIRHPNVVMFFGGGKFQDGTPFLVMELMHRGSLTAILHNKDIALKKETKFSFALDGARGMNYLHMMNPPRIHRDLKSANLLVSLDWTVRVADFGSARLVESSKEAPSRRKDVKRRGRRHSVNEESEPLVDSQRTAMTQEVGTMQWLAPEILARKPYGASVDIYSYGIVMWEIWTRRIPHADSGFRFASDLKAAVIKGYRPMIPDDCPEAYARIIKKCWASDSKKRPFFSEIETSIDDLVPFEYDVQENVKSSLQERDE